MPRRSLSEDRAFQVAPHAARGSPSGWRATMAPSFGCQHGLDHAQRQSRGNGGRSPGATGVAAHGILGCSRTDRLRITDSSNAPKLRDRKLIPGLISLHGEFTAVRAKASLIAHAHRVPRRAQVRRADHVRPTWQVPAPRTGVSPKADRSVAKHAFAFPFERAVRLGRVHAY